jgi:hypothetical protein
VIRFTYLNLLWEPKKNYVEVMKREKLSGDQGHDSSILGYERCRRSAATLVLTP